MKYPYSTEFDFTRMALFKYFMAGGSIVIFLIAIAGLLERL